MQGKYKVRFTEVESQRKLYAEVRAVSTEDAVRRVAGEYPAFSIAIRGVAFLRTMSSGDK